MSGIIALISILGIIIVSLSFALIYIQVIEDDIEHKTANKMIKKIRTFHPENVTEVSPQEIQLLKFKYESSIENRKTLTDKQMIQLTNFFQNNDNIKPKIPTFDNSRGIVICAGGNKYLTCAWVNIGILRKKGCTLPIEIWHKKDEISNDLKEKFILEFNNVTFHNADFFHKSDIPYSIKAISVMFSNFTHMLFLDADNNCLRDPTYLFDTPEYKKHHAILWPDYWDLDREAPIFKVTGQPKSNIMFSQESGQMVINRKMCFNAILLCFQCYETKIAKITPMAMPMPCPEGDKDIWMNSFISTNTDFYFIPFRTQSVGSIRNDRFIMNTMGQKDPSGNPIFMHRNTNKWNDFQHFPTWTVILDAPATSSVYVHRGSQMMVGKSVQYLQFRDYFGKFEEECLEFLTNCPLDVKSHITQPLPFDQQPYPLI
jgi:alpha 1,2-mannosyltransferase